MNPSRSERETPTPEYVVILTGEERDLLVHHMRFNNRALHDKLAAAPERRARPNASQCPVRDTTLRRAGSSSHGEAGA